MQHYGYEGPFDTPVTEELCTGTDWYHWNIQKSELYYLFHRSASFAAGSSLKRNLDLKIMNTVVVLVFLMHL